MNNQIDNLGLEPYVRTEMQWLRVIKKHGYGRTLTIWQFFSSALLMEVVGHMKQHQSLPALCIQNNGKSIRKLFSTKHHLKNDQQKVTQNDMD